MTISAKNNDKQQADKLFNNCHTSQSTMKSAAPCKSFTEFSSPKNKRLWGSNEDIQLVQLVA